MPCFQATTPTPAPTLGANLALSKPTAQSSTYDSGISGRAVDGNTNSNFHTGNSCSHTENSNGWWYVDLQRTYLINNVKVYSRTDCCGSRLIGAVVKVGASTDASAATTCGTISQQTDVLQYDIACDRKQGRYVFVTSAKTITLCEVNVYGSCTGTPPAIVRSTMKDSDCGYHTNCHGCASMKIGSAGPQTSMKNSNNW